MTQLTRGALDWMHDHEGVITLAALDSTGVNRFQCRRLVDADVLERVLNGVYALGGAPISELSRCVAVCLARPNLVISGPSAGRIHGLRKSPRDGLIHATAPPFAQPLSAAWAKIFRTSTLHKHEVMRLSSGLRVTDPSRTAVDHARVLTAVDQLSMIESVLSNRLGTVATMTESAQALVAAGVRWAERFLRVIERRGDGPAKESDWELKVFEALRDRGVVQLVCQHRESLTGRGPVRFDLCSVDVRWVLEVDVHPQHRTLEGQGGDHRRDRASRREGWVVERVGEYELLTRFDAAMDEIAASFRARVDHVTRLHDAGLWVA